MQDNNPNGQTIVRTDDGAEDGQTKCPRCGSTEISPNPNSGQLRCAFCRHEFEPEKVAGFETNIWGLKGHIIGSGAQDIAAGTDEILTLKCGSCAAEVVIDTREVMQARCHWCRNTLSIKQQIPNGAVPDMILPFGIKKDAAQTEIEKFVGARKFFAHPRFKAEFTTNNIMGVYLPYMVIDINAHVDLVGKGEKLIRQYTKGSSNNKKTYYDADLYNVKREFDLTAVGLTVESSADKLNNTSSEKTNNIINSIMPFDTEKCVKWDANHLKGYTSEKRDTNIGALRRLVDVQTKDIARHAANDSLKKYDRGVCWEKEQLDVHGQQWKAAYLPVWLYSYQQVSGHKKILHYVAVNARTKETMGSVPIHMPKLISISAVVEVFGAFLAFFVWIFFDSEVGLAFLLLGFIFFTAFYYKYRNPNARHYHEKETKTELRNLQRVDQHVRKKTGLTNSKMIGANNLKVHGHTTNKKK